MDTKRLQYLFEQHDSNRITEAEKRELYDFLGDFQNREEVFDFFEASLRQTAEDTAPDKDKWGAVIEKILASPRTPVHRDMRGNTNVRRIFPWKRVAAAAAILILVGIGYFLFFNQKRLQQAHELAIKNDVEAPKGIKAMITLANGQKVRLDSVASGTLATQGNVQINKSDDGRITYSGNATGVSYNTLVNPRGSRVVSLTLSDGSEVWLNAASSLTYPTAFTGNVREVTITGEAYFEVAHRPAMPFKVRKGDVAVTVLGTHFNVNAYDDENSIKVTLLEGSVKVQNGSSDRVIKPGQQAQIENQANPLIPQSDSYRIMVQTADLEEVMAWKNGRFNFNSTSLGSIMREVGRWYDVDIEYQADAARETFTGDVPRKANVSQVLKMLELTNTVHFKIEGKKIIVTR